MNKKCPFFKTDCRSDCMMAEIGTGHSYCVIRQAMVNIYQEDGEIVHLVDSVSNIGRELTGRDAWDDFEEGDDNE